MELTDDIREHVAKQNKARSKKLPWSLDPVEKGFRGGFFKYDKQKTFIMSTEQTKMWLAQIHELIRRREMSVSKL